MPIGGPLRLAPLFATLLLGLLAACAGANFSSLRPVGGPVLSEACQRAYHAYGDELDPVYFAADPSGQACAATVCRYDYCMGRFPGTAIRACERVSGGADCFVYADGVTQSWRGPEPVDISAIGGQTGPRSVPFISLRRDLFSRFRDD